MSGPAHLIAAVQNARALAARGDLRSAAAVLDETVEVAVAVLGAAHPEVLGATRLLASLHRDLGELSSARRLLESAIEAGQRAVGDADPMLLSLSYDLATLAHELGNRHEARRNFARLARYGPAVLGVEHPQVEAAQRYLAEDAQPEPGTVPATAPQRAAPQPTGPPPTGPPPAGPPPAGSQPADRQPAGPPPAAAATSAPATRPAPAEPVWPDLDEADVAEPYLDPMDREPAVDEIDTEPEYGPPAATGPRHSAERGAPPPRVDEARRVPQPRHDGRRRERRSRTPLLVFLAVLAVALAGGGAAAVVTFLNASPAPRPAAAPTSPAVTAPSSTGPPAGAPTNVRLRDFGSSITLTWTDPTDGDVPFVVAGGRADQGYQPLRALGSGETTYTLNGLNPGLDYCFLVAAVYSAERTVPADPVCTHRRASPTPGRSGSPAPSRSA